MQVEADVEARDPYGRRLAYVIFDGDKRLARHVANAVLRADSRGTRLVEEHKDSRRRIDLAVAAVMAHDRARALASRPKAAIYVLDG